MNIQVEAFFQGLSETDKTSQCEAWLESEEKKCRQFIHAAVKQCAEIDEQTDTQREQGSKSDSGTMNKKGEEFSGTWVGEETNPFGLGHSVKLYITVTNGNASGTGEWGGLFGADSYTMVNPQLEGDAFTFYLGQSGKYIMKLTTPRTAVANMQYQGMSFTVSLTKQ